MNKIIEYCNSINKINNNIYFIKLRTDTELLPNFIQSFKHFVIAVDEWSRVIAKVTAYVPSYNERRVLVANLFDENNGVESHVQTFEKFVELLNSIVPIQKENCQYALECTKEFVNGLHSIEASGDWIYAVAALGMIEYTYVTISKNIHQYVTKYTEKDIPHFAVHETLDVDHAIDLFKLVSNHYSTNEDQIIAGIVKAYGLFDKFFSDIYITLINDIKN